MICKHKDFIVKIVTIIIYYYIQYIRVNVFMTYGYNSSTTRGVQVQDLVSPVIPGQPPVIPGQNPCDTWTKPLKYLNKMIFCKVSPVDGVL